MPRKSINAMKLKANAEEADWYATPQGRRQTLREFTRALKGGTLIRSTGSRIAKSEPAHVRERPLGMRIGELCP